MKRFRFILNGQPKDFWAYRGNFISKFITSYPQYKNLKLSDLKDLTIID